MKVTRSPSRASNRIRSRSCILLPAYTSSRSRCRMSKSHSSRSCAARRTLHRLESCSEDRRRCPVSLPRGGSETERGCIHPIHDVPFPYNVPYPPQLWVFGREWPMLWNEAMVVQAFLSFNNSFEVTMSTPLIRYVDEEFLKTAGYLSTSRSMRIRTHSVRCG